MLTWCVRVHDWPPGAVALVNVKHSAGFFPVLLTGPAASLANAGSAGERCRMAPPPSHAAAAEY